MPFCLLMRTAKEMFELVTKVNLRRCFLWWYFLAEMKSQLLERGLTLELYKQNSFLCLIMLDVVVASTKVTRITYNIFNSIAVYVFGIIQRFETWFCTTLRITKQCWVIGIYYPIIGLSTKQIRFNKECRMQPILHTSGFPLC